MSYLEMYMFLMLDSVCGLSIAAGVILLMYFMFCYGIIHQELDNKEDRTNQLKELKVFPVGVIGLLLFIIGVFCPNTKQAALIYITPQIVNNEAMSDTVKNIPELTKLGTDYLKELLKEKTNDIKG